MHSKTKNLLVNLKKILGAILKHTVFAISVIFGLIFTIISIFIIFAFALGGNFLS